MSDTDNSKMILLLGGDAGIKSYVQELLNKISSNVEVVTIDELPTTEERLTIDDVYHLTNYHMDEIKIDNNIPKKEDAFRGGSRKKGGKTKYIRR